MCAVKFEDIQGYEKFTEFVNKLPEKGPKVYFYFAGKKDEKGHSWCIYCQMAEPVIRTFMSEIKQHVIFGFVDVGERTSWKDQSCSFRTDPRLKLMVLPTIVVWNGVQRLEGSQCAKVDLLQMLFEDEE